MPHPLQQKIQSVRRRARLLVVLHALAWTVALVLGTALALGVVDYFARVDDVGVRLIFSAALAGVVAATFWLFVLPALRYRRSDVDVARRIEHYFPQFGQQLSSAVAFLGQSESDRESGSPALRRAVVAEMSAAIEALDLARSISSRPVVRIALIALVVSAIVTVVCVLDVQSAGLAAWRLFVPGSNAPWPRRNDLAFEDPRDWIASGDDFRAVVVDRNRRMPEVVAISYWFEGDSPNQIQTYEMKLSGDRMVHRLSSVTRSFQYRAEGGDYTGAGVAWLPMRVVQPPRVASLHVTLDPPAYSGLAAEHSDGNFRALVGTRVQVQGESDKPLSAAHLVVEGESPQRIAARLSDDGRTFSVGGDGEDPWVVQGPGTYGFELVDQDGYASAAGQRWEMQAWTDEPPTVVVKRPSANVSMTAAGWIPWSAVVRDDLAVRWIELRCERRESEGAPPRSEPAVLLFQGPEQPPVAAASAGSGATAGSEANSASAPGAPQAELEVEYRFDLARLPALTAGEVLTLQLAAADYQPQVGTGPSIRVAIITADEFEDRTARRLAFIVSRLADALRVERNVRGQVVALENQIQESARLAQTDVDPLQSAELNQRQVRHVLGDTSDGAASLLRMLLDDLAANRQGESETFRRTEQVLLRVEGLRVGPIPAVEAHLTSAVKATRAALASPEPDDGASRSERGTDAVTREVLVATDSGAAALDESRLAADSTVSATSEVAGQLRLAGQGQDEVIAVLESLLDDLSQWDRYRRFLREIGQLRREQEQLLEQTGALGPRTIGRDTNDLTPQDRADLKTFAQRQGELSRRFDRTRSAMETTRVELAELEPSASLSLGDALEVAARLGVGDLMREGRLRIEQNQLASAADVQQQLVDALQEMLDVLSNRRENDKERLVKELREALDELDRIEQVQRQLGQATERLAGDPASERRRAELAELSRRQREAAEQVARLTRRLERLSADEVADALERAAHSMSQAADAQAGDDAQGARDPARQAEEDLAEARRQLEDAIRRGEQDLLQEQFAQLQQQVQALVLQQQGLLDTTTELNDLRVAQGEWTPAQLTSLGDLAGHQRNLGQDTSGLADEVAASPVFELALIRAARPMSRAADVLEASEAGETAQQLQRDALERLNQLLAAFESQADDPNGGSQPDEQGNPPSPTPPNISDPAAAMAQLKLLRVMQEDVRRRTQSLDEKRRLVGFWSAEEQQEVAELAQEQGRLAELIVNLSQPPATDSPDELPGLPDSAPSRDSEGEGENNGNGLPELPGLEEAVRDAGRSSVGRDLTGDPQNRSNTR